ncbi:MAG: hypothetical protein ABIP46_13475 [Polaromonas sp.]
MLNIRLLYAALALAVTTLAPSVQAQTCEGGAYLNPQLFRGEAALRSALAEQEVRDFIGRTGLPTTPLYSIKRTDDITASGRAPYCWAYVNPVVGLLSGYKLVVVNNEAIHPAVVAITAVVPGAQRDAAAVELKSLPAAEQKAILDRMQRSKCFGTADGVEAAIVRAEGICGNVDYVAAHAAVGQQGLIAKAAFEWEEQLWAGIATREASALTTNLKGLAGRFESIHSARLVVIPTKGTSLGFGLYVHPSVPEATVKKVIATFQGLSSPSKPLAVALDLGPQFSFVTPSADQVEKLRTAIGIR